LELWEEIWKEVILKKEEPLTRKVWIRLFQPRKLTKLGWLNLSGRNWFTLGQGRGKGGFLGLLIWFGLFGRLFMFGEGFYWKHNSLIFGGGCPFKAPFGLLGFLGRFSSRKHFDFHFNLPFGVGFFNPWVYWGLIWAPLFPRKREGFLEGNFFPRFFPFFWSGGANRVNFPWLGRELAPFKIWGKGIFLL